MISVSEALDALFALAAPTQVVEVPLIEAAGRVLASDVAARRNQPPFAASAMDGYAVKGAEVRSGARFKVIGESAAGKRFSGRLGLGEAVRIFTGGVVPEGADRVIIQEDVTRDGQVITLGEKLDAKAYVRPVGADFAEGDVVAAPRRLTPEDIALLAAMNIATVPVFSAPRVALISTGDELVMPGETPGPDQIIASNTFGLHAMLREMGAAPRLLPIARDSETALRQSFDLAAGADLVVTIGGASVGDHDVVAQVMSGAERAFYKVAMRPGKPLMAGRLGEAMMVGLPGNPVSAMVCGRVFLAPVVAAMQGLPPRPASRVQRRLAVDLPAGGPREHYMRARMTADGVTPFESQDSGLLRLLSHADLLLVRPVNDAPRRRGDEVDVLPL